MFTRSRIPPRPIGGQRAPKIVKQQVGSHTPFCMMWIQTVCAGGAPNLPPTRQKGSRILLNPSPNPPKPLPNPPKTHPKSIRNRFKTPLGTHLGSMHPKMRPQSRPRGAQTLQNPFQTLPKPTPKPRKTN